MMNRIAILLDEQTAAGLATLAKQEYRDPRSQAALIIREELERRGLLQPRQSTAPAQAIQDVEE
jgi:hypothetical protein